MATTLPIETILELIRTDRNIRSSIIEKDDSIVEHVYKYIDTPGCGACIAKLTEFINQNAEFINSITQVTNNTPPPTVPDKNNNVTSTPKANIMTPIRVSGEVYEIDATPEQYTELINLGQQQRWVYRGLNILERTNDDGKKVWMVFFY